MFITVPNATALSRQMAVKMNLLSSLYELTENDLAHGHRRVFDKDILLALLRQSGFRVVDTRGTFLKPFSDESDDWAKNCREGDSYRGCNRWLRFIQN